MRIDGPHSGLAVARQQYLFLEFDLVRGLQERLHIDRGRGGAIGAAKLERQLVIGLRQPFFVEHPPAEHEAVVVETEPGRVEEDHLAHMDLHRLAAFANHDVELLRNAARNFPELVEMRRLGEMIALQEQLVLTVLERLRDGARCSHLPRIDGSTHEEGRFPPGKRAGPRNPRSRSANRRLTRTIELSVRTGCVNYDSFHGVNQRRRMRRDWRASGTESSTKLSRQVFPAPFFRSRPSLSSKSRKGESSVTRCAIKL